MDSLSSEELKMLISTEATTINWNQLSDNERKDTATSLLKVLEQLKK
jgi:hypothetical protein